MKANENKSQEYKFRFTQQGGLVQPQISTIDDVLNLDKLDPKLWTVLACPVKGLEFSEETLSLLDSDKNGRVRVPEILEAVSFIKKYFKDPSVIMTKGDSVPLTALGDEPFSSGHSPLESAKALLKVLGKEDSQELFLSDLAIDDKLFSPAAFNGDGVLPPEACADEKLSALVNDIIEFTGGQDDVSGVKGITRNQAESFFESIRGAKNWRDQSDQISKESSSGSEIFFLKDKTDAAAASYMQVSEKINDYFLRCSLLSFDNSSNEILASEKNALYLNEEGKLNSIDQLSLMPLAEIGAGKPLSLLASINPAWKEKMEQFKENVLNNITNQSLEELSEKQWRKIESLFAPYVSWFNSRPADDGLKVSMDRIMEILSGNEEAKLMELLDKEESYPPVAASSVELRKLLLLRRDFIELLKNFVSFENFYNPDSKSIFQCGTLYLDGRSCDLCFKIEDVAKHSTMAVRSACFLVYCDLQKHDASGKKMQIAALMSDGKTDNIIVGRNGIFYDRNGEDWDATITKIIDNPVNIKQAFFKPYKKLGNLITERINKMANDAEAKASAKMTSAVNDPKAAATAAAQAPAPAKKTDIGTVAALSVAFTGIATIVGAFIGWMTGLGKWIPLGVIGILLAISLPSMIIAAIKLRQRNIASILDACGWAVNGNVKITPILGRTLTHVAKYPVGARLAKKDPYAQKGFPWKRLILCVVLLVLVCLFVYFQFFNTDFLGGTPVDLIKGLFTK